jgi:hypothetical protein
VRQVLLRCEKFGQVHHKIVIKPDPRKFLRKRKYFSSQRAHRVSFFWQSGPKISVNPSSSNVHREIFKSNQSRLFRPFNAFSIAFERSREILVAETLIFSFWQLANPWNSVFRLFSEFPLRLFPV